MNSIYSIKNLYFTQDSFSLSIEEINILKNEKIAVLGENGCGKTTFLNIISGFNSDFRGNVTLEEKNIKKIPLIKNQN